MDTKKAIIALVALAGGGLLAHCDPSLREAIFPLMSFVVGHIFGNGNKPNGSNGK